MYKNDQHLQVELHNLAFNLEKRCKYEQRNIIQTFVLGGGDERW